MTIIEQIRKEADLNECEGRLGSAWDLRHIADRLERSGALVPVSVGEALSVRRMPYAGLFTCDHAGLWRLVGSRWTGNEYEAQVLNLLTGQETYLTERAQVQPVRLERWEDNNVLGT